MTTPVITTAAAVITPGTAGQHYMAVTIDGDPHAFQFTENRMRGTTLLAEATRMLAHNAGYRPVGDWRQLADGGWIVDVTEADGRCTTCVNGCGHTPASKRACGHHGCAGQGVDRKRNSCPGAAIHVASRWTAPRRNRRR